jgi:hypothetical protein
MGTGFGRVVEAVGTSSRR